jgi:type I restriction-modification system DNA methylase subunit
MQTSILKNNQIDLEGAVSLLGVSSATIRNWIRHDYLTPDNHDGGKLLFNPDQVRGLKEKIDSGEIDRLNKRANKKGSANTFIPDEYADNVSVISFVESIIYQNIENQLDRDSVLLSIALNLLKEQRLIEYKDTHTELSYRNKIIEDELTWWLNKTQNNFSFDKYSHLLNIKLPEVSDLLGVVYQSLVAEGNKAQGGSYYTPKSVVDEVVNSHVKKDSLVLDPCCGTGQFLLSAAGKVKNPRNIWGFDIDETAARLARLNLLIKFPDEEFSPNIYHKNTLLHVQSGGLFADNIPNFDVVITNPPWGVHFSQSETNQLQGIYPSIQSNEAFSYFLDKGLNLLKDGGVLSFILPESILNIKTHRDVREIILSKSKIQKIKYLDRVFKNVFTPVIRLDVVKAGPSEDHVFEAEKTNNVFKVEQLRLKNNHDYIFDVFSNDTDMVLIEKVYAPKYVTLENNADWALGVVTGDNKKHLKEIETPDNEPILTGKDIKRFITSEPKNFIKFEIGKFQQVAPEHKYRAEEKLIYKFISKDLVFAYDNKKTLTLNSANILIPKVPEYPVKTILALFNSSLYQFVHQKKFGAIKVLKSDIEKLPLPILDEKQHKELISIVDQLLDENISSEIRKKKYMDLDTRIMDIFSLTEDQKAHVVSNVKISDKLLSI